MGLLKSIAAPEIRRREKLLVNIERQINAAKAEIKGDLFTFEDMRHVTHPETGERTRQRVSVPVRPWWWKDMSGTYFTFIKYGNKKLELAKDKFSIEVGEQKNIATTLTKVMEAVKSGELDELINTLPILVQRRNKETNRQARKTCVNEPSQA